MANSDRITLERLGAYHDELYKDVIDPIRKGAVYDISAANSGASYASLSAALGTNGANIPDTLRKGGMSVKFVRSSDNMYVQYRLMSTTWSTTVTDWQGVDSNINEGSKNLAESGAVFNAIPIKETTNDEYIDVLLDKDNRIIEGVKQDGTKYIHKLESPSIPEDRFKEADATEYIDAVIDKDGRLIEGIKKDGTKYVQKLQSPTVVEQHVDEAIGYIDAVIDNDGKLIYGVEKNGTTFIQKLESPTLLDYTPLNQLNFLTSKLNGKKWVVLGDSFTNGDIASLGRIEDGIYKNKQSCYPYLIGNRTGANIVKFFEGGRTLAFPANPGTFANSICNPNADWYYQNIPADADYITIYLGINDSHHRPGSSGGDGEDNTGEIPIGTATDNTTSTYYGAWNVVLSWLRENRPFAHVGIIISNACDTAEYEAAQLAMAEKYGYPYLNLNGDERCPAMLRTTNANIPSTIKDYIIRAQAVHYADDGNKNWHPNAAAHAFESLFIENFLLSI